MKGLKSEDEGARVENAKCEDATSSIAFSCHSQRDHSLGNATWVRANASLSLSLSACSLHAKISPDQFRPWEFPHKERRVHLLLLSLKCVLIPQPFLTGMQTT